MGAFEKERSEIKPRAFWTAVAERSSDTVFERTENFYPSLASREVRKVRKEVLLRDLCVLGVRHLSACRKRRRRSALPAQSKKAAAEHALT